MLYRFHDCEIDEDRRSLRRRGFECAVQPKVFDLLVFLMRHRSRLVPKDLLLRELWPDAIVSGASLTRLVKEARRVVGDDGRRQKVIRTANRRGYRFVAQVEVRNGDFAYEGERAIELARRSLEASVEFSALELQERVHAFVETCLIAVQSARQPGSGVG